ncbi:MAG: hypothetical protein CM15mP50_7280 [Rhodobacterales bacterium]|nr:MAG: hypothetical protein CM15mP50_7280 [Rhodobacterales bacterium]
MGNIRNIAFWLVLFLLVVALFNVFSSGSNLTSSKEVSYSEFLIQVEKVMFLPLDLMVREFQLEILVEILIKSYNPPVHPLSKN